MPCQSLSCGQLRSRIEQTGVLNLDKGGRFWGHFSLLESAQSGHHLIFDLALQMFSFQGMMMSLEITLTLFATAYLSICLGVW